MSIRRLMATAAGGLVIAFAAGTSLQAQAKPEDLKKDTESIKAVSSDHLLEIRLGTIAQKKASNPAVKQFGERMVTDHTRLLNEWRALLSTTGYPFQPGLTNAQEQEFKRLDKESGAAFDRDYMTSMIQDHQNAVAKFQDLRVSASSEQVRALVATGLPVIQEHLSLAAQVGNQVGASGNVAVDNTKFPDAPTAQAPAQNAPVAVQNTGVAQEDLKPDVKFIREAAQDNLLEIRLGQMALKKAVDPAVREYAQRLVSDHTIMQNQWIELAAKNGMTLKSTLGPRHKKKADRLDKLSERAYERAFMTTEVQNHQDYLEYFSKEGKATHSSQVRELAANDLRSMELHLSQAKQVGSQIGVDVAAALRARETSAYRKQ
jgi:putative membrane protein